MDVYGNSTQKMISGLLGKGYMFYTEKTGAVKRCPHTRGLLTIITIVATKS